MVYLFRPSDFFFSVVKLSPQIAFYNGETLFSSDLFPMMQLFFYFTYLMINTFLFHYICFQWSTFFFQLSFFKSKAFCFSIDFFNVKLLFPT